MEELVKQPLASYRELGFSRKENEEIVRHLNRNLANYHVHFQKMRNFHWNVKGQNFLDLHAKFEALYDRAYKNIDKIAEHIRVFGDSPVSTLKEYIVMSEIKEANVHFSASEMVKETIADFDILLSTLVDTINAANEIGDIATIDMATKMIKGIEKDHWMLTSWMSREL